MERSVQDVTNNAQDVQFTRSDLNSSRSIRQETGAETKSTGGSANQQDDLHLIRASMHSQDLYDQILASDEDNELDSKTMEIVGRYIDNLHSAASVEEQSVPPSLDRFNELGNIDPRQLWALQGMIDNIQEVGISQSASFENGQQRTSRNFIKPQMQSPIKSRAQAATRLNHLLQSMEKSDMSLSMAQLYEELKLLSRELGNSSALNNGHIALIETQVNKIMIEQALEGRGAHDESSFITSEIMLFINKLKLKSGSDPEGLDSRPFVDNEGQQAYRASSAQRDRSDPPTTEKSSPDARTSATSRKIRLVAQNMSDNTSEYKERKQEKKLDPDTENPDLVRDMSGELARQSQFNRDVDEQDDALLSVARSSCVEVEAQINASDHQVQSDLSHRYSRGLDTAHSINLAGNESPKSRPPPSPENRRVRSTQERNYTGDTTLVSAEEKKEDPQAHVPQSTLASGSTKALGGLEEDDASLPSFLLAESASIDLLPSESGRNDQNVQHDKRLDPLLKSGNFDIFYRSVCDNGSTDKIILAQVVRFTFPFLCDGSPTNDEYDGLRAEAINMGLSSSAADQFFEMIRSCFVDENGTPTKEGILSSEMFNDGGEGIEFFLERLIELNPKSDNSVDRNGSKLDASSSDLLSEKLLEEAYAHDVPENEGDDGADDSIGSNDDPWWEVPQKLGSRSAENVDHDDSDELEEPTEGNTEPKEPKSDDVKRDNTLEETGARATVEGEVTQTGPRDVSQDIENFWKVQDNLRDQQILLQEATPKIETDRSEFVQLTNRTNYFNEDTWIEKRSMALWNQSNGNWLQGRKFRLINVDEPEPIDGVDASAHLSSISKSWTVRKHRNVAHRWQKSYKDRASGHSGYMEVDVNSLYQGCTVNLGRHRHDSRPWEHRDVKQRFLYEPSIAFCRNWFGSLGLVRGNILFNMPVCRPKSMEMPMRAPGWKEDWFRTPTFAPIGTNPSASHDAQEFPQSPDMSQLNHFGSDEMDSEDWEDAPECGTLRNVKYRPGDRITRLTPELTSSLRRSRWRKKHFPRGTFPY